MYIGTEKITLRTPYITETERLIAKATLQEALRKRFSLPARMNMNQNILNKKN
jgi:hypothetical protein